MFYSLAGGRSAAHQGEVVTIDGKRHLLGKETTNKRSIHGKRLKAGWDENYLLEVFSLVA